MGALGHPKVFINLVSALLVIEVFIPAHRSPMRFFAGQAGPQGMWVSDLVPL